MFFYGTVYAESEALEPPEVRDDSKRGNPEDRPFHVFRQITVGEEEIVKEVREHDHGEVERRQL